MGLGEQMRSAPLARSRRLPSLAPIIVGNSVSSQRKHKYVIVDNFASTNLLRATTLALLNAESQDISRFSDPVHTKPGDREQRPRNAVVLSAREKGHLHRVNRGHVQRIEVRSSEHNR